MDCNQIVHTGISDGTATGEFTFFTPNANVLTGADCTKLVNLYGTPSPCDFPHEILNLQGQRHIFQFHYNPSCEKGKVDFYFDDILDKPMQITCCSKPSTQVSDTPGSGLNTPELQTLQLPAKETMHGQPSASPTIPSHLTTSHATIKTPASTEPGLTLKDTPDNSTEKIGEKLLLHSSYLN
ncbi:hypothetical protein Tco_0290675 [Tanacetum coccineum]